MSAHTPHTPGPWWVDGRRYRCAVVGFNRIGDYALIRCADPAIEDSYARLIAAAPETAAERDRLRDENEAAREMIRIYREDRAALLDALREVMAELDGRIAPHGYIYRDTGGMILARAAIAKAEGR